MLAFSESCCTFAWLVGIEGGGRLGATEGVVEEVNACGTVGKGGNEERGKEGRGRCLLIDPVEFFLGTTDCHVGEAAKDSGLDRVWGNGFGLGGIGGNGLAILAAGSDLGANFNSKFSPGSSPSLKVGVIWCSGSSF